mgnify:CR=1 FL=1
MQALGGLWGTSAAHPADAKWRLDGFGAAHRRLGGLPPLRGPTSELELSPLIHIRA